METGYGEAYGNRSETAQKQRISTGSLFMRLYIASGGKREKGAARYDDFSLLFG